MVLNSPVLQAFGDANWILQLLGSRNLATVADAPLDKKVEMTNWEKVSGPKLCVSILLVRGKMSMY